MLSHLLCTPAMNAGSMLRSLKDLTLEHPKAAVTERAPQRGHEPPRGGRQAEQTQQPQFSTTGSCSSCMQPGLAHRKSARLSRGSCWECTACDRKTR